MITANGVGTPIEQLIFGVESDSKVYSVLQNNLDLFEWVTRNKRYPAFWGRSLTGKNHLARKEIDYLHARGCKIAIFCSHLDEKDSFDRGKTFAKEVADIAYELRVPKNIAIFVEIPAEEHATTEFLQGYANTLLQEEYTPGFKANTDAMYSFDREYSRGIQIEPEVFEKCLIWATAPNLAEYERITTSHIIHPDNWEPFAPSGIKRNKIAVWQYGKNCHSIDDNYGHETVFHVNLVRNQNIIQNLMF